jgi:hypothetical protein
LDIHASRFQPPASDSVPKTQDTSGRLSQPELLQCDQVSVSLKTSRDISALGFPTCCKTWQDWVTERRGAWRARVNAARLTREKGSSFWPSVVASEVRQGFQDRSRGMKGSQESLTTAVVTQELWGTPRAGEGMGRYGITNGKRYEKLYGQVLKHGQAAPVSSSSLGSRQGLWATPTNCDHKGATTPEACKQWESQGQNLPEMVVAQWGTPAANDANKQNVMCEVNSKQAGLPKSVGLELQRPWMTPNARDWKGAHGEHFGDRARTQSLNNQMEAIGNKGAKLNPRWVETLMGLPIGWTMPSCTSPQTIAPMSCDSLEMELCLPPQSEPSEFSLAS